MPPQPIDFLFSPYRRRALAVLFLYPDEQFHVRELERRTGISAGSLHRELKAMAEAGILQRARLGNLVLYQANRNCPIYGELAAIFRKTVGLTSILAESLNELSDRIDFAFVFGSVASGDQHAASDIDICVLGEIDLFEIVKALATTRDDLRRQLNPVVMRKSQFLDDFAAHDRFIEKLMEEPKIFVIGSDDELAELVHHRSTRGT